MVINCLKLGWSFDSQTRWVEGKFRYITKTSAGVMCRDVLHQTLHMLASGFSFPILPLTRTPCLSRFLMLLFPLCSSSHVLYLRFLTLLLSVPTLPYVRGETEAYFFANIFVTNFPSFSLVHPFMSLLMFPVAHTCCFPSVQPYEPADDWSEHISSSGKKYYYNCRTEVSQWEKPKEWLERY